MQFGWRRVELKRRGADFLFLIHSGKILGLMVEITDLRK